VEETVVHTPQTSSLLFYRRSCSSSSVISTLLETAVVTLRSYSTGSDRDFPLAEIAQEVPTGRVRVRGSPWSPTKDERSKRARTTRHSHVDVAFVNEPFKNGYGDWRRRTGDCVDRTSLPSHSR
jgi:hypothetical protein